MATATALPKTAKRLAGVCGDAMMGVYLVGTIGEAVAGGAVVSTRRAPGVARESRFAASW